MLQTTDNDVDCESKACVIPNSPYSLHASVPAA